MKAVKLAVRALAILFLLAVVGHWLDALWLSRVAAVGMAVVLVIAGLVAAWTGWDDTPESIGLPTWPMVQPQPRLQNPPRPKPEPRVYRLDRKPRKYQDGDP